MRVCPSVRPSVGPSIPRYFQTRTRRILCRVSGLVSVLFSIVAHSAFLYPPRRKRRIWVRNGRDDDPNGITIRSDILSIEYFQNFHVNGHKTFREWNLFLRPFFPYRFFPSSFFFFFFSFLFFLFFFFCSSSSSSSSPSFPSSFPPYQSFSFKMHPRISIRGCVRPSICPYARHYHLR